MNICQTFRCGFQHQDPPGRLVRLCVIQCARTRRSHVHLRVRVSCVLAAIKQLLQHCYASTAEDRAAVRLPPCCAECCTSQYIGLFGIHLLPHRPGLLLPMVVNAVAINRFRHFFSEPCHGREGTCQLICLILHLRCVLDSGLNPYI